MTRRVTPGEEDNEVKDKQVTTKITRGEESESH